MLLGMEGKPQPRHLWSEKVPGHVLKEKNQPFIWPSHAGIAAQSGLCNQHQPPLTAPLALVLNTNSKRDSLETVLCVSRWFRKTKTPRLFPVSSLSVPSYPLEGCQRATVSPQNEIRSTQGLQGEQRTKRLHGGGGRGACAAAEPPSPAHGRHRGTRSTAGRCSHFPFQHFPHPPAKKAPASCRPWLANASRAARPRAEGPGDAAGRWQSSPVTPHLSRYPGRERLGDTERLLWRILRILGPSRRGQLPSSRGVWKPLKTEGSCRGLQQTQWWGKQIMTFLRSYLLSQLPRSASFKQIKICI